MAKRTKVSASGRTRAEAAAHRHVEYVQADSGDIEPFRMDTAIAEAVFEVSVAEGADRDAPIAAAVQAHVADPEAELTPAEALARLAALEVEVPRHREIWQSQLRRQDFAQQPFMRVVGKVVFVLTQHRGMESCSGNQVHWVFLAETPHLFPAKYHQRPGPNGTFNTAKSPATGVIYARLNKLKTLGLLRTLHETAGLAAKDYVMTADGLFVFTHWDDVPGPSLAGPTPPRRQRQSGPRGKRSTDVGRRTRG
jgi:hypothetical protein